MATKISELKPGQKNVYLENVRVVETGKVEEYERNGQKVILCNGKIIDDSVDNPIAITAWDHAAQFLCGAKTINIENCFAKEYQGKIQISTGKFGRIKKIN